MEKLKPCPFCGGEAYIAEYEPRLLRPVRNHPYSVWCNECELAFGWDCDYGGIFDTKEEAVKAWNSRADGWIPVKERLPKAGVEVLVLSPVFGKLRVRIGVLAKDRKTWGSIGGALEASFFPYGTEPVFWKPLPELPEGGEAQ